MRFFSLGVDFINILRTNFFAHKIRCLFWGMATGEWRKGFGKFLGIFSHKFGEFSCALWGRMLVKLNGEFFTKSRALACFRLAKNFGEIDPRWWIISSNVESCRDLIITICRFFCPDIAKLLHWVQFRISVSKCLLPLQKKNSNDYLICM